MSDTFRTWLGACVIVLVGAATYANSLSGRMLLDDQSAIVLNPQIRHLWPLTEALAAPRNNELESRPLPAELRDRVQWVRSRAMDRLAENGLTYTQWHTAALCSPTRSATVTTRGFSPK